MTQVAAEYDLTSEQGTTFDLTVAWTDQDLFNYTGTFEIYRGNHVYLTTTDDLQVGTLVPDEIVISIPVEDMELLPKGTYKYRLDLNHSNGTNLRLLKGLLRIL